MKREIQELLPFYLNGTLDEKEQQRVEQALDGNDALQAELDLLRDIQHSVKTQPQTFSPGEFGLKRLQKELGHGQYKKTGRSEHIRSSSKFWPMTAAAACLILIVQTGYFLVGQEQQSGLTPAGGPITQQTLPSISLTFAPEAQEQDIRALLLSVNASIVEGPSALGVYRLAVRGDRQKALVRLQAHTSIIDSVQLERNTP